MARARTSIFCEKCGAEASVRDRDAAQARYCANCKLFICTACWDGDTLRCTTCAGEASKARSGPHANLHWASTAFRDLATVRPELEILDANAPHGSSSAQELQHRLLAIKADDTTSAALRALANAPQDETTRVLRQRVELERRRVAGIWSAPTHPPRPRRHLPRLPTAPWRAPTFEAAWSGLRSALGARVTMPRRPPLPTAPWRAATFEAAWSRLRSALPFRATVPHWRLPHWRLPAISMWRPLPFAAAAAAGGVIAMIVGATVVSALLPPAADPQFGAVSRPSVEGDVAGARSSPSPSSPPPTTIRTQHVTFDALGIGMPLPDRWRVRGSAASVQVVAFPNPFDRSLQIMSSIDGGLSVACYRMGAATGISLDVFSAAPAGMAVRLREREMGAELGVAVDDDGSILLQRGNSRLGDGVLEPALWYHVSFVMGMEAGTVTLQIEPRDAIGLAGVQVRVPFDWPSVERRLELCVVSPSLGGEAAMIDNVTVEYRGVGSPD